MCFGVLELSLLYVSYIIYMIYTLATGVHRTLIDSGMADICLQIIPDILKSQMIVECLFAWLNNKFMILRVFIGF